MTIHNEQPDDEHPESLLRQGHEDQGEPLEMGVPGEEGKTADPATPDGQLDSQDMPTTDGEMTDGGMRQA
ncbi:hypothetical protein M2152_002590 [Microbacteriaceae bacterium SG_E_30_P1]|uniref:Uncharacterized protein n=1 Tax=Antiquaquibacter oligotrophicus TaxID=2880260 RepID=A0ABT6KSD2_9MICO|nr:hypothetical protein [Antiquaquibacter oligotrophicus]MDH6182408.1 hypothetical protein [Antiquaquibacter oligotrophicus]UDF14620.1 hypothetical protein LH407_07095 [Antiquaquibacter oligotrophicus]